MTTQDKINLIREKCVAANPSIMELGFGCEVMIGLKKRKIMDVLGLGEDGRMGFFIERYRNQIFNENEFSETLGRPIRLADVLLAIGSVYYSQLDYEIGIPFMTVNVRGQFLKRPWEGDTLATGIYWNLLKDSLTDQSEETVEFLYSLLK